MLGCHRNETTGATAASRSADCHKKAAIPYSARQLDRSLQPELKIYNPWRTSTPVQQCDACRTQTMPSPADRLQVSNFRPAQNTGLPRVPASPWARLPVNVTNLPKDASKL
jgi:hypothetical protein